MANKEIKEMVNEEMRDLLQQISDLAYQASEEVYDDDDKEEGTAGILCLCDQLYEKIDNYLMRYKEKISKEMIKDGLDCGVIDINMYDEYGCMGLYCRIGDNGFYFGEDINISEMDIKDFYNRFSKDEIIDMIYKCLKCENDARNHGLDECEYESYFLLLEDMYDYHQNLILDKIIDHTKESNDSDELER